MRKVIGDIPVPQALSAPSESGSYVIPKGHFVMACPGVAQMDPMLWKDSKTWVPSRWTDKDGFAGKAGELYDSKTVEQVDYGFGGPPFRCPPPLHQPSILTLLVAFLFSFLTAISKGTQSPYQPFGAGRHRCIGEVCSFLLPPFSFPRSLC
jgi:sterol 14-demethylase